MNRRRQPSRETPLGPGAKKDGCFRRLLMPPPPPCNPIQLHELYTRIGLVSASSCVESSSSTHVDACLTKILDITLILCSTICVPSATRHNIHMYPYFLFAAIHHLKSSPSFSVRPCSSVGRVTVNLIRRSWVRFPPRSKDFFFASCGSLFPITRANAQWVIHGFK